MTSYDKLWLTFLNNTKVDDLDLPQTPERIYEVIHNAILHFNNRLRDDLGYNDDLEQLDRELSNDHLIILAHYIRYSFLLNQLTYFQNVWQPFTKDVGMRNFSAQLKSLETSVDRQKETIDSLIMNMQVDFL